jgi:hypothetical protein
MRSARRRRQGGRGDTAGEQRLEGTLRGDIGDERRREGVVLGWVLVRQDDVALRAHAVLQRVLRRARLARLRLRPARLSTIEAARRGAGARKKSGHVGFLRWWSEKKRKRNRLQDHRNLCKTRTSVSAATSTFP